MDRLLATQEPRYRSKVTETQKVLIRRAIAWFQHRLWGQIWFELKQILLACQIDIVVE